jgi:hypothetical protein
MGGSSNAPSTDYKAYWNNYIRWTDEANVTGTRSIASTKAKLSAHGIAPDTELWKLQVSKAEEQAASDLETVATGYTATTLQKGIEGKFSLAHNKGYAQFLATKYPAPASPSGYAESEMSSGIPSEEYNIAPNLLTPITGEDANEYMKSIDKKDAYTSLSEKLHRTPLEWEYKTALLYGVPSATEADIQNTLVEEAENKANAAAGKRSGSSSTDLTTTSPGLLDVAKSSTSSPWV